MNSPLPTASLCIYGDSLDPEVVTKVLGVAPSRSHKKDEVLTAASGKTRIAQTGAWLLFSNLEGDHDLADSVNDLLEAIKYRDSIWHISNVARAQIALAVRTSEQPDVGSIPALLLARIAELELDLSIEVY